MTDESRFCFCAPALGSALRRLRKQPVAESLLAKAADGTTEAPVGDGAVPKLEAAGKGTGIEQSRARSSWAAYQEFLAAPGHKCGACWLLKRHCACAGLPQDVRFRPRVVVLFHHLELGKHLGSNTAKLLLHFGGELCAWGIEEHDRRVQGYMDEDPEGCIVLFPAADATTAAALAQGGVQPRLIIVLDGGWSECKRMNVWIDPRIRRCVVTSASREEFGGTRKYGGKKADADCRVQTAAAFVALLQELGEEAGQVDALREGLRHFTECWEAQICRSKKWVS